MKEMKFTNLDYKLVMQACLVSIQTQTKRCKPIEVSVVLKTLDILDKQRKHYLCRFGRYASSDEQLKEVTEQLDLTPRQFSWIRYNYIEVNRAIKAKQNIVDWEQLYVGAYESLVKKDFQKIKSIAILALAVIQNKLLDLSRYQKAKIRLTQSEQKMMGQTLWIGKNGFQKLNI